MFSQPDNLSLKRIFLCILVLAFVASSKAQTATNVIDRFDPAGIGANTYSTGKITNVWKNWFGGAFSNLTWDATMDANTNAGSGSLKIVAHFPVATDQFEVWNGLDAISPTINAIQFTNFECDVRFAAGSATNSSGTFGSPQFGMPTTSYGQNYFSGGTAIPASNTNWVHISIPLNPVADPKLKEVSGILIHLWGAGLSGHSTLWVDNIQFVGMATNSGTVTINYTNTQQRIDGFGASSAWMSGTLATSTADLLFSTNTGAGLSLLRTRITPDVTTWEGNIAQQAQARGARIWSTPWSPPMAYKDTNSVNGGHFVSSATNFSNYAAKLAKYVVNMQSAYGINLYALSIQNEPDFSVPYESCVWTGEQIHDFVPYLAAALTASNVAATKIMLPEKSNWNWSLATNTMNDTTTSNLVDILAAHNYGSAAAPVTQFGTPCPKTVWETEHYFGSGDDITNGLAVAQQVHDFMTVAQANAYHYWWLTGSGNGSIANNAAAPAKRLFTLGNYSRFIRPDFYRIGATNTSVALVSAYKDPSSSNYVIVAANPSAYPVNQTFVLTNFPATGVMTQWVTSASLSLSNQGPVSVTNNTFTYLLPGWTIVSFKFTKPFTNAPAIVQQPADFAGSNGGNAAFSVVANGSTPLAYQWLFNGSGIPAETNASLILTGLVANDAGNYSVIVTNFAGSITSAVAVLTITTNFSFVLKADDGFGGSSFNSIGNWTNTATGAVAAFAPTNGYTYATGPFLLRTPASAGNYTFAGDELTVSVGGQINIKGGNGNIITFSNLTISGTINNSINANQNAVLAGKLMVLGAATFNTQATNNDIRAITNTMILSGSGTLTNTSLGSLTAPGTVVFTGNNTAFTGPLIVNGSTILQAASQTNLGGNPASFNAAQLVLDKGTFQPLASMILSNANSGVTIGANGGTFKMGSSIALTSLNPITGGGNLSCIGGGVLVLAGTNTATGHLMVGNSTLALVGNATFKNFQLSISNNATLDVTGMALPLTISNQISLAGNLLLTANSAGSSSKLVASNLLFGGTLTISNSGPAFAAGNSFTLFAASNYSGVFTSITPATPGSGLVWDTSKLSTDGTIQVGLPPAVSIMPASTNIIYGNTVVLTANATGTTPLAYQWYDNQTNVIIGAIFPSLTNTPAVAAGGNYTVIVTNQVGRATNSATLTVTKAALVVAANNTNRVYGAANPIFTANYSGFVNGETLAVMSGAPGLNSPATSSSEPGNYLIVATNGTLTATNYNFTFVNGTLAVTSVSYPTNLAFSVSGGTLTLNWPVSHLGWTLQTNSMNLANPNSWFAYPGSTALTNVSIAIDPTKANVFYRLINP